MGETKVTKMIIRGDLQCYKCCKKIKKTLCKIPQIRDQVYDEKNNKVMIVVVCCNPEKIRDKICAKACGSIESIEIVEEKPPEPPKPKEPEKPKEPPPKPKEPEKPKEPPPKPKEPEKPKEPPPKPKEPEKPKEPPPKPKEPEKPKEPPPKPKEPEKPKEPPPKPKEPEKPKEPPPKPKEPAPKVPVPAPGYPPPVLFPVVYCPCCGGYGGPCCYGRPPMCPDGCGRPVYECYGGNRGYYVSRCDYFNEENATGCTIM